MDRSNKKIILSLIKGIDKQFSIPVFVTGLLMLFSTLLHAAEIELRTADIAQNVIFGPEEEITVDIILKTAVGETQGAVVADAVILYETDILDFISADVSSGVSEMFYEYSLQVNAFPIVRHNSAAGLVQVVVGVPGSQAIAADSEIVAASLTFKVKAPFPFRPVSYLTLQDGSVEPVRDTKVVLNDAAGSDVLSVTTNKDLAMTLYRDTDDDGQHNNVDTDDDGDGMLDEFENLYIGTLSSVNPNDAHIDSDGDSFTNLQEHDAGSDPTDQTVYTNAPEICGDGVDQNLDGSDTIGFLKPWDVNSPQVCFYDDFNGDLYYFAYDDDENLLFTIDRLGYVTETRYDPQVLGQVVQELAYHNSVLSELSDWRFKNQENKFPVDSAPSASDIHNLLIEQHRAAGTLRAQLLANGSGNYPLDEDQWSGNPRFIAAHESDERLFRQMVLGDADTPAFKQRFNLEGFTSLINNGELALHVSGAHKMLSTTTGIDSRWIIRFFNSMDAEITSPAPSETQVELTNQWQQRDFYVDIPTDAAEVQIELQVVMDFGCKPPDYDVCTSGVQVLYDDIKIAALLKDQVADSKDSADLDNVVLYDNSGPVVTTSTYYVYDGSERLHYYVDGDGYVTETLYHADGQLSEIIKYTDSIKTQLDSWRSLYPNEPAPTNSEILAFLGSSLTSNHVKYNVDFDADIGQTVLLNVNQIVQVLEGTGPSVQSLANEKDGTANLNAGAVEFIPSGGAGIKGFDMLLTGDGKTETLRIEINYQ